MELTHTFTVPASPERTWALLTDLQQVGSCFPGATVTEADGDTFSGTVKVKLGPIQMQYAGTGLFLERDDAAHRAVIEGKGKDKRGNGTASATATLQLRPDGTGTTVEVLTDLSVTGKPAQFGRGVMQDVSDKLLGQFVDCLEGSLGPDEPVAATSSAAVTPAAAPAEPLAEPAGSEAPPPLEEAAPVAGPVVGAPVSASVMTAPVMTEPTDDGAIDLGHLVGPVLRERYGTALAAGVAGVVLGILIGRAGRRG
jgi:carbon monoxide dehydrogenase subunit G